jgi:hypothetical protein
MMLVLLGSFVAVSLAGIPEPSLVLYGTLTVDQTTLTSSDQATVIARVSGVTLPVGSYTMGDNPAAQSNYVLRIRLESLADGSSQSDDAAVVGQTAQLFVHQGIGPERPAGTYPITASGIVARLDLAVQGGISWHRAVYYDNRYPNIWTGGAAMRDRLVGAGYQLLDADALKTWMDARIADHQPSVVVFTRDAAPATVAETMSPDCTMRRYLDAGGKVVWYGDIPLYYRGNVDGTATVWGVDGSIAVLGLNAAGGPWGVDQAVMLTTEGLKWGLQRSWLSVRPASATEDLRVLARDVGGHPAAWIKHYVAGDTYRGFVRAYDRPGVPSSRDMRRLADFGNLLDLPDDGDFDGDDRIDLGDYDVFNDCLAGDGAAPNPTMPGVDELGCLEVFDTDGDGDVDLSDFADLQDGFTG